MRKFKGELKVGGLAMIIGGENRRLGSVVTVSKIHTARRICEVKHDYFYGNIFSHHLMPINPEPGQLGSY